MAETTTQKALTLENLTALRTVVPTKAEVTRQIEQAALAGSTLAFATDEEVLALFQEPEPGV